MCIILPFDPIYFGAHPFFCISAGHFLLLTQCNSSHLLVIPPSSSHNTPALRSATPSVSSRMTRGQRSLPEVARHFIGTHTIHWQARDILYQSSIHHWTPNTPEKSTPEKVNKPSIELVLNLVPNIGWLTGGTSYLLQYIPLSLTMFCQCPILCILFSGWLWKAFDSVDHLQNVCLYSHWFVTDHL